MDATTPTSAAATLAPQTVSQQEASVSGELSGDLNTFLQLLTAQLENQDPLEPVDSTEFVAQLASFSAVEQQTITNDLLEELVALSTNELKLSEAVSWIGREVSTPGSAEFDGSNPVQFHVDPPVSADSAEMRVYNDFGQLITQRAVTPDAKDLSWNGLDATGEEAPIGSYTAQVVYMQDGEVAQTVTANVFAQVEEARLENGTTLLVLENGGRVSIDDVAAVRGQI